MNRREILKSLLKLTLASSIPSTVLSEGKPAALHRSIPSTGQQLPVIGMGSYITFNVGNDSELRDRRVEVLRTFFNMGGQLVDSSPMYGSSEAVLGYCLKKLGLESVPLFSATKVWTSRVDEGRRQIADSHRLWGVKQMSLNQVHNLVSWREHLDTLFNMKDEGRLQYVGITTSHGRRHQELEHVLQTQPVDFVQLSYHLRNREVENRLLPLAQEKGIAVIVNRPFAKGRLFDRFQHHQLPNWASDFDCQNWAQFFLKFVVSHPAVTCAIPATSRVDHMVENMGAGFGRLPDTATRQRMLRYVQSL